MSDPSRVVVSHRVRMMSALVCLLLSGVGGCAALTLGTLATVIEAAGSAEPAAREVFSMGKIDTAADA